jgi:nucleoside-diphosphate-sugar epimerase
LKKVAGFLSSCGPTGDLVQEKMGLSEGDWKRLTETVQVILHNAATILFNEPLDEAVMNNTFGALNVLNLAKNCRVLRCLVIWSCCSHTHPSTGSSLKMMVHCSTAYANAPLQAPTMIREVFCVVRFSACISSAPPPLGGVSNTRVDGRSRGALCRVAGNGSISSGQALSDHFGSLSKHVHPLFLSCAVSLKSGVAAWCRYTFTKNLTEQLLERRRGNTPVCIVRPSIVTCTYNDPIRGWIDNLNAAGEAVLSHNLSRIADMGTIGAYYLMGSLGALRYLWGRSTLTSDMIPVDYVSNAAIVAAMYCSRLFDDQLARQEAPEMQVFHVATSHRNPITYGKARTMVEEYSNSHPAPNVLRPWFGAPPLGDDRFQKHSSPSAC